MTRLTVEVQGLERAQQRLGSLILAGRDPTALMRATGEDLKRSTEARFAAEEDPEGKPWAPLAEFTRAKKKRNVDKILAQDGYLQRMVVQADRQAVEVGSNLIYAGVQQGGAKKGAFGRTKRGAPIPWGGFPAREFLELSDADREEILETTADYIKEALGSG